MSLPNFTIVRIEKAPECFPGDKQRTEKETSVRSPSTMKQAGKGGVAPADFSPGTARSCQTLLKGGKSHQRETGARPQEAVNWLVTPGYPWGMERKVA